MEMNRAFKDLCFATAIALQAMAALAQPAVDRPVPTGPIEVRLESHKVVRAADGKEALVKADAAKPGDVIEYAVTYRNTSSDTVRNLEATLPIPAHTEFIHGTTRPASAKASLDSTAFADMPLKRRATRDGKALDEMVPFGDYRYLRWYPGELAAGKSLTFSARVKVVE
jgi:uncharacterized repeat protein (TIGR01451 family)